MVLQVSRHYREFSLKGTSFKGDFKLYMVAQIHVPSPCEVQQDDKKLKVIVGYISSLRPACCT